MKGKVPKPYLSLISLLRVRYIRLTEIPTSQKVGRCVGSAYKMMLLINALDQQKAELIIDNKVSHQLNARTEEPNLLWDLTSLHKRL